MPTDVILEVDASAKYRKVPVLSESAQEYREKACARRRWNHVLQVQHCGRIVCRDCGAEWKAENF
jgi:hypothetical protein